MTEKSLRKNRLDATYKSIARLYQTAWDQTIAECLRALSGSVATCRYRPTELNLNNGFCVSRGQYGVSCYLLVA